MTAEELEQLVRAGNARELLDARPGVAESERTKLAKTAMSLTKLSETGEHWKNNWRTNSIRRGVWCAS